MTLSSLLFTKRQFICSFGYRKKDTGAGCFVIRQNMRWLEGKEVARAPGRMRRGWGGEKGAEGEAQAWFAVLLVKVPRY